MEGKKEIKISLSTIIIIILILFIVFLLGYIYMIKNAKNESSPNNNIDIQGNNVYTSTTINESKTQNNTEASDFKETPKEDTKSDLIGEWKVEQAVLNNKQVELRDVFGSSINYGIGSLYLDANGEFRDYVGSVRTSEFDDDTEGSYTVSENIISLNCKSKKSKTLKYSNEDNKITYQYGEYTLILGKNLNILNQSNGGNNIDISNDSIDRVAKELFEEGSLKIRETEYTEYPNYEQFMPLTEKKINGVTYMKRFRCC